MSTKCTTTPGAKSPATSGQHLSKFENGRRCRLRQPRVEFLENGLSEGQQISHLSGIVSYIHPLDMTWPAASVRLKTAV